jgi:hypothetical protein
MRGTRMNRELAKPVDREGYIWSRNCEIHKPSNESSDKEMALTILHHLYH